MTTRRHLLAATVLCAVAATSRTASAFATAAVTIDNFSFSPRQLNVTPGTEVTRTNHDDIPHTIVVAHPELALKSPVLDTDDHVTFAFPKPGTYRYFCSLHPHMQGTVIVA